MNASNDDYTAIHRLVMAYSFAASTRDAAAIGATFALDGVLVGFAKMLGHAEEETVGPDAIKNLFAGFLPGVELIHQMSQLGETQVEGNSARAVVMATEYVRWRGQALSLFMGVYTDELARTQAGWRFSRRTLVPRALTTLPGEPTLF